jgi:hypothetical protein
VIARILFWIRKILLDFWSVSPFGRIRDRKMSDPIASTHSSLNRVLNALKAYCFPFRFLVDGMQMTKSSPEIPEFKIVTDEPFKECDRPAFTTAFDELFISSVHTESLVYTCNTSQWNNTYWAFPATK